MSVKIVFADDNATMRQIVYLLLDSRDETEDVDVITVSTGEKVVEKAKDGDIDIVLLDYQMPPGNDGGIWAANQLKGTVSAIIFLSAYTRQSNIDAAERAGALAYVGKETILEGEVMSLILKQDWEGLQELARSTQDLWFFEKNLKGGEDE